MRAIESLIEKGFEMKTITTFIVGTALLVGSALAAQKPATSSATPAAPSTNVQKAKKHRKHKKPVASKVVKPVANKSTTPVTPAAPKK